MVGKSYRARSDDSRRGPVPSVSIEQNGLLCEYYGMIKKLGLLLLLVGGIVASASALTLKIGTVAPTDSPWTHILHNLAGQWERLSNGSLTVEIYSGGTAGGESDMIRKMRIGQLQGAALTQLALGRIVPNILALDVPFLITSNGEFDYILAKSRPEFDKEFNKAGYKLLTWSSAGWVRFFSTQEVASPSDLKKLRLGVPAGDDQLLQVWRKLGFDAIPLPIPDIMTGLQSGMINAFYAPPSAAVVYQWFRGALNMSAFRVAPVIIGLVIDNRSWDQIPKPLRKKLVATTNGLESELNKTAENIDQQAISTMKQHGLTIDPITPTIRHQWEKLGAKGADMVVGNLFSHKSLEQVKRYLKEYQSSHGS